MLDRIVVDASAMVAVIAQDEPPPGLLQRIIKAECYAPELISLEILHALSRRVRRQELALATAEKAVDKLVDLPIVHVPHQPFVRRIWELRHSVTPYDAAYVAIAEDFQIPVVTADGKLSRSNGHSVNIELYSTAN